MKRILGIISNIFSIIFVGPFSIYFGFLGLLFFTHSDFTWSITGIINIVSSVAFMCAPLLCIIGVVLSFIFRRKGAYAYSYLIQLLPFASVLTGIFLMVVSMFWNNP